MLEKYTRTHANILNKLSIPDIASPVQIKVLWFRPFFLGEKNSVISTEMHLHTFFEAHFIIAGKMEYADSNSQHFTLTDGRGIIIPPCISHIVSSYSNNCFRFSLAFMVDEESDFYHNLISRGICDFPLSEDLLSSINSILREIDLSTVFSLTLIRNRILEIICAISRAIGVYEYQPSDNLVVEDKRVTAAKLFISDNKNKLLTCQEVAGQCGLSPKQMNRIFHLSTGKTLHDYIDAMKIKDAEHYLADTNLPLKEISEILGFSSVYYFNRYFSKNTGMPPAYFRKISAK